MPRIAPAEPPYSPAIQARLDKIMPPGAPPLQLFRVMARDERLFSRFMDGGLLDKGHLSLRQRELAIWRVCALNGSEYEWGVHVNFFAERVGLTPAETWATTQPFEAHRWVGVDALIVRLCDTLQSSCELSAEFWAELRGEFTEMALLELIMIIGKYRLVSLLTNTLRLEREPGAPAFPEP